MGLLQPIADALKLLTKEIIQPTAASKGLFVLGPVMAIMPALAAWVAIPFGPDVALANVNAGLLLVMAITSIEVYGVIIAGWASNSKYAFLGALACVCADGELRNCDGLLLPDRDHGVWQHEPDGNRDAQGRGVAWQPTRDWSFCPGTGCHCCRFSLCT
jgi:hypothetical protein